MNQPQFAGPDALMKGVVQPPVGVGLQLAFGLAAAGQDQGAIAADGASWTTTEPLGYNRKYKIEARAFGLGGASTTVTSFTTSAPGNVTKPYVLPNEGDVVGIGQPIAVQFDENIPDRKAAEAAEKKAARDARYAARKANVKIRR